MGVMVPLLVYCLVRSFVLLYTPMFYKKELCEGPGAADNTDGVEDLSDCQISPGVSRLCTVSFDYVPRLLLYIYYIKSHLIV